MRKELTINGVCDPAFKAVREALAQNLADGEEIGECISIVVNGKTVVDLWGGYKNRARTQAWEHDTLVCMFSVGKPVAILPVLMLIDRGRIDPEKPVMHYWPEFGQAGKEKITVQQLIAHLAAIPGALHAAKGDAYHWGKMIHAIEVQEPFWEPGTSGCYHTFTMGYLAGELVRRVTGRTVGQFLQEEICLPLQLDYHFGLSAKDQRRCAEIHEAPDGFFMNIIRDTDTLLGKCWVPLPLHDHEEDFNSELYRAAEMPSFNGQGTTRSVARLFCALACDGMLNGVRLLSESTAAYARREAWNQTDVFGIPSRMSNGGFMLCNEQFTRYNSNPHSFGHIGLGGALAFGDPDSKFGFSFCGNRMAPIADLGSYAKRLLEATELSLY